MKNQNLIRIAEAFSPYPGPRYAKLGDYSGEEFREEILIPALKKGGPLTVDLDGTKGYGSSFLEEAFGGAVRKGYGITRQNVNFITEDESLESEVWGYIDRAMKEERER